MCGIVGVAGSTLTTVEFGIFEDLLSVCQVRGRDATGVIRVFKNSKGGYTWAKRLGPPEYLLDSRQYQKEIDNNPLKSFAYIGHCRHKTVGENTIGNAHPFDIDEKGIVGVHNGTLKNYYSLSGFEGGYTDSRTLYETLAKDGPEKTFSNVEGAFACVWWNEEQGKLFFIRNKERPLHYTFSKDGKTMFWASEPWMFGAVSRKAELWKGKDNGPVFPEFEPYVLYSLEIEKDLVLKKELTITPEKKENSSNFFPKHHQPEFLKHSASTTFTNTGTGCGFFTPPWRKNLEQDKPVKNTTNSSKNTLSLVPKTSSPTSAGANKSEPSTDLKDSQNDTLKPSKWAEPYYALKGVDFRYIKAVDTSYITDRRTGKEWTSAEFFKTAGKNCCFCGNEVAYIGEVSQIFDGGKRFMCHSCEVPELDVFNVSSYP